MKIAVEEHFLWIGILRRPWRRLLSITKIELFKKREFKIESHEQMKLIKEQRENRYERWEQFPRI